LTHQTGGEFLEVDGSIPIDIEVVEHGPDSIHIDVLEGGRDGIGPLRGLQIEGLELIGLRFGVALDSNPGSDFIDKLFGGETLRST